MTDVDKSIICYIEISEDASTLSLTWTQVALALESDFPGKIAWPSGRKPSGYIPGANSKYVGFHNANTKGNRNLASAPITIFTDDSYYPELSENPPAINYVPLKRLLSRFLGHSGTSKKPQDNKDYPHTCPHCGAPAYVGIFFGNIDCSENCC